LRKKTAQAGIKGKKVTVVGGARSGIGSANLLHEMGADVTVTDVKSEAQLGGLLRKLNPGPRRVFGGHPDEIFLSADMLVVSPGVPLDMPVIQTAKDKGVPVIGELELAYRMLNPRKGFLAVTGTNGKSTTTALLDSMLKRGGFRTLLGGNIGNALTDEIYTMMTRTRAEMPVLDFVVAEVSSFQLESTQFFRPMGSVVLNISPDHLDRYHSMEEYRNAKARIFENQRAEDFLVLNYDDPGSAGMTRERGLPGKENPRVFYFSRTQAVEGIFCREGIIFSNLPPLSNAMPLIGAEEIKITGVHNLENAMAASAMALLAGCPVDSVRDSLRKFPGLEHRLEFVREIKGIRYFNDSKGTNVGAVIKSLESFPPPVILIAGGRDKAGDFSLLRPLVKDRVKAVVLIGEASEKIKNAIGDITKAVIAEDLKDAVEKARNGAMKGDVVLLSPACASFDMFRDFEDRGRQFKKIVQGMTDGKRE
jgi:UDP-N-acetylmuramoylalanine--D-glutamate ligase